MIRFIRRVFFGKTLESKPCGVCDSPSFDGVCPSCFNAGRKWKHVKQK